MSSYRAQVREVPFKDRRSDEYVDAIGYEARVVDGRGKVVETIDPGHYVSRPNIVDHQLLFRKRSDAEKASRLRVESLTQSANYVPPKPGRWTDTTS